MSSSDLNPPSPIEPGRSHAKGPPSDHETDESHETPLNADEETMSAAHILLQLSTDTDRILAAHARESASEAVREMQQELHGNEYASPQPTPQSPPSPSSSDQPLSPTDDIHLRPCASTTKKLERLTIDILNHLKHFTDLENDRVAVVGSLAVTHYLPDHHDTADIVLLFNTRVGVATLYSYLESMPQHSLHAHHSRHILSERHGPFAAPVTFLPAVDHLSYVPASARALRSFTGALPQLDLTSLIILQMYACAPTRPAGERARGAADALALLRLSVGVAPVRLDARQTRLVEGVLPEVVAEMGLPEAYWRRLLNLDLAV